MVPLLPFLVLPLGVLLEKGRAWIIALFGVLLPLSIVIQILGVALDFNPYLAALANSGQPDLYIWNPAASPLLEHWKQLWQPGTSTIRSLSLDQLGFRPLAGHLISGLVVGLFMISGLWLCKIATTSPLTGPSSQYPYTPSGTGRRPLFKE